MAQSRKPTAAVPGVVRVIIDGVDPSGRPLVRWGHEGPSVPATSVWMPVPVNWAACRGLRALAGFVDGDTTRPVILGLLDSPPAESQPPTLKLSARDDVVIECGGAKIHLRSDGSVQVTGERILSRAKGTHRIKGGAVQIN